MQSNQFVNKCQANASTFEAATLASLDSVKSLKEPGNSSLGIPIPVSTTIRANSSRSACCFSRTDIEPSNVNLNALDRDSRRSSHISRSIATAEPKGSQQTFSSSPAFSVAARKTLANSAVYAGIRKFVIRSRATRLNTRKLKKGIHQLQETGGIPVNSVSSPRSAALILLSRLFASRQVFQRSEHQRQRRSEFMANVGEERSLGAIISANDSARRLSSS